MAYTKLLDETKWDEVNEESKELLDDYILELEANGKSVKTIAQYRADIRGFLSWIQRNGKNKNILELKKRDFRNFFLKMSKEGVSNARINRLQSSIRNLLAYAEGDEDIYEDYETNQMRNIKGLQKEPVRDTVFLKDEQITKIIDYLVKKEDYQKALYVSLSYDSAARRNEIHQVKKEGFSESGQTNTVVGKRGKKFKLIYFNRTRELSKLWLKQRGEDDIESLWVVNVKGEKSEASYDTIYTWAYSLRKIIKEIDGSDLPITAHSFRHTSLENYGQGTHHTLKELGKTELPLNVLKVIAHHSDISTTQSYLDNHDDQLLEDAFGVSI